MKSLKRTIQKKIAVKLVGDAEHTYHNLRILVEKQQLKGIQSSKEITLLNGINRVIELVRHNPFYGENAKKNLIPKEYMAKYDVENLFIADLPDYWRMVYTLESNEVEIIAFILDIFDHDNYDKMFGFRKR